MGLIIGVFNQKVYPGVGTSDYDDCWCVSAIQCAAAVAPWEPRPTIKEFRAAAGDPDDGVRDTGTHDELMKACRTLWPELRVIGSTTMPWATFLNHLKAGRVASLSVMSGALPDGYQYGYKGGHQVTVYWEGLRLFIANPLQPQGTAPRPILEGDLRRAAHAYSGPNEVTTAIFPSPAEALATKPKETPPMPAYDPIGQAIGQVTVTTAGHALYLPHEPDPQKAYVQITTLPYTRNVFGAGHGDKVNCPPSFRDKDFWLASLGGNVAWLLKADAGAFIPAPVVLKPQNCDPAIKTAVNGKLAVVEAESIAAVKAAVAGARIP